MTKMSTKGQVRIRKRLRDRLGLKPGSEVDFELAEGGRVFIKIKALRCTARGRACLRACAAAPNAP
jgi:AbrB family looped-hinge helix DNA binding protein